MRMQPPEDHDDSALFRAAIGEVTPLRKVETPAIEKPRPKPRARMAEHDEQAALSEFRRGLEAMPIEAGDTLSYHRNELPARIWQRLKRGQFYELNEIEVANIMKWAGLDLPGAAKKRRRHE